MKKLGIYIFVISVFVFIGFQLSEAAKDDYYRTYEIIGITENGLTLQDSKGNTVEIDKNPKDYKVGYIVRYDKIRNRLRKNSWQKYKVTAVTRDAVTLQHKTGDTLSVDGYYIGKYNVGDQVRYNYDKNKLKAAEESDK